jgi:hypothetical protein
VNGGRGRASWRVRRAAPPVLAAGSRGAGTIAIRVARGALSRLMTNRDNFVIQVRGASNTPAAAALGRALEPLMVALEGGPKFVSSVLPSADGPWIMVDAGPTPTRLLRTVPDVIAQLLAEEGVVGAVIDSPPLTWQVALEVTSQVARRGQVCLNLLPPPPPPEQPRRRSDVPTRWLAEAAAWVASGATTGQVAVDVEGMSFGLNAEHCLPLLEECQTAGCLQATLLGGVRPERVRAAMGFFEGPVSAVALIGGGPAAAESELAEDAGALRSLARRLARDVAYGYITVGEPLMPLGSKPATEWWLSEGGGGRPAEVDLLVDEVVFDGFFYQVLGPRHLTRSGEPPPGARPLDGQRVELQVGDLSSWISDGPERVAVREEARRLLRPWLLKEGDDVPLMRTREAEWAATRAERLINPQNDPPSAEASNPPSWDRSGHNEALMTAASGTVVWPVPTGRSSAARADGAVVVLDRGPH